MTPHRVPEQRRVQSGFVPDALTSMLLIALPVLAAAGWWRVVRGVVTGGAERVLATGIWTVLQFSGGLAALGWLGLLSMPAALLTQAALTISVWAISTLRKRPTEVALIPSDVDDESGQSGAMSRVIVGIVVVGVVAAGVIIARTLWYAALLPIDSADGSTYHLPILIDALRTGRFGRPESVWTFGWTSPKAADMAFLWLMLGNRLDLVLMGQILFLPLGVAATAALAVWAGVRRKAAWFFGGMIVFVPIVVVQATTAYVDIAGGALFLAAIATTVLYRSGKLHGTFGILTVFAAVGLAAGAKYSFLVPGAILLIVAFWPDLRRWNVTKAHAFGVLVLLVGSHWYLAPLIWYGNPSWPYEMPFLSGLFPNYLTTVDAIVQNELSAAPSLEKLPSLLRPLLVWIEAGPDAYMYTMDSRQSGLGPLWFILWLPAILAWALMWMRTGRRRDLLMIGAIFAVSFVIQTYAWWTRFTWWIVALGIIATAVVYERSAAWVRAGIATLVVLGGIYVLAFTNVQGAWTAPTMDRLLAGDDPVAVTAGDAVAYAHRLENEIIAVPGLAWGSWNTYLLGADFSNTLVIVPPGEDLLDRIRASGATILFDPGWPVAWPEENLEDLDPCLQELSRNHDPDQSLHRIDCP